MRIQKALLASTALLLITACSESEEAPRTVNVAEYQPNGEVVFLTDDVIPSKLPQAEIQDTKRSLSTEEAQLSQLQKAAISGDPAAQLRYAEALIAKEDPYSDKIAYYWITQAAQSHAPEALYMLGYCYYAGIGTPVNYKMAKHYFIPLAEANIPQAQYYLAKMYYEGTQGEKNIALAKKWIGKAMASHLNEAKQLAQSIWAAGDAFDEDDSSDDPLVQVVDAHQPAPHAIDANDSIDMPDDMDRI